MIAEMFVDNIKVTLAQSIKRYAVKHKMSQTDMAYLMETTQPRVSNLFSEKISKFSLDQLLEWAYNLGINIEFNVK